MTALVTGASGGLGGRRSPSRWRAGRAAGAVGGSNVEKLETSGRTSLGWAAIMSLCRATCRTPSEVDQLVPQAVEALGGKLDILVNNAGVTRDNLLMRMKDEEFEDVIRRSTSKPRSA